MKETNRPVRRLPVASRPLILGTFSALMALLGAADLAARSVGVPEATPKIVIAGVPTTVTVTSSITDPNLIPNSVVLQQVDATGKLVRLLGGMFDTGGGLFSAQPQLKLDPESTVFLQVAATFNGTAGQVVSGPVLLSSLPAFITKFDPKDIQQFLVDNNIKTAAKFLEYLEPATFKRDWILMTDSDSTQTSTATSPRVLIQSVASDRVFGFKLDGDDAAKSEIEYIQWDGTKFRFHAINTAAQTVTADAGKCLGCHSVKKLATNGPVWPYPRPNWDAYDSWGGALPYNRDRIYKDSVEATAMAKLLTNDSKDPIIAQLELPNGMTRDGTGKVTISFPFPNDFGSPDSPAEALRKVAYDAPKGVPTYPGKTTQETPQGGTYLLMRSTDAKTNPERDGGRGVAMFDHFSAFNAQRIAQELADSWTGKVQNTKVDIRPVALAITIPNCVTAANLGDFAPPAALAALVKILGMQFPALQTDTGNQQHKLPQMKANQEAPNVKELLNAYGSGSNPADITKLVARRSKQIFNLDTLTAFTDGGNTYPGFMIDREDYSTTPTIALFRFFLEPVGEPVNKWTMSIYGNNEDHSTTYTFADVFDNIYIPAIQSTLNAVLKTGVDKAGCTALKGLSTTAFQNFK
jgi:hypothetical protein